MQYPNFQDPQFVDAAGTGGLNAAMTALHGAISTLGSGMFSLPGITAPEAMTVAFSGLTATVTLPQPWGLVVGGAMIRAHGTQTGVDTQSYTVSFSGAVPSSGSVTAWLAATTGLIQQNPFPIPGPPPGHPSWNPNFVPTIGYAMNQDTILLSTVTGGIDNVNTFGLLSTTLSAGQTGITAWTTSGQVRADVQKAWPPLPVVGGLLTVAQAQQVLLPAASGQTSTLPRSSLCAGLPFAFVNNLSGSWTFAASGTDSIISTTGASGSSLTVPTQGAGILWTSGNSIWELIASNPILQASAPGQEWTAGPVSGVSGNILTIAGSVLGAVQQWTAGLVSSVSGNILTVSGGVLGAVQQWSAGPVSGVSGNILTVSGDVLGANAPAQQWTAGAVSGVIGGTVAGDVLTINATLPAISRQVVTGNTTLTLTTPITIVFCAGNLGQTYTLTLPAPSSVPNYEVEFFIPGYPLSQSATVTLASSGSTIYYFPNNTPVSSTLTITTGYGGACTIKSDGTYWVVTQNVAGTSSYQANSPEAAGGCFLGFAQVEMADGTSRMIRDVKIGEMIKDGWGLPTPVLALHRPVLGGHQACIVNGYHVTTTDHPFWTARGPAAVDPEAIMAGWNIGPVPVIGPNGPEMRINVGLKRRVKQLVVGDVVPCDGRMVRIDTIERIDLPPETPLHNLVLGGSHTYRVDGLVVTGWPREDDWDYQECKPLDIRTLDAISSHSWK